MTTDVTAWHAAIRAEADERATLTRTHRAEADRLMAEADRLMAEYFRSTTADALDQSTRLHRQAIDQHGTANEHAARALMLRAQADRAEADLPMAVGQ